MKNVKIVVQYLLICAISILAMYLLFALIASFTMLDWRYMSITEWASPFRLIYGLIALWIACCSAACAIGEWK